MKLANEWGLRFVILKRWRTSLPLVTLRPEVRKFCQVLGVRPAKLFHITTREPAVSAAELVALIHAECPKRGVTVMECEVAHFLATGDWDPFADYVTHEVANIFHNCKRETIGLPYPA
jgi:hypothetical protein